MLALFLSPTATALAMTDLAMLLICVFIYLPNQDRLHDGVLRLVEQKQYIQKDV